MDKQIAKNTTVVVGASGQDGKILSKELEKSNCQIVKISKDRVEYPNGDVEIITEDLLAYNRICRLFHHYAISEVYYLAAFHHSSEDEEIQELELFKKSFDIHVTLLIRFLEAIRTNSVQTKLFYAASSHVFGDTETDIQNENTSFKPNCIYGITKNTGMQTCWYYRQKYNLSISVGILYNHESLFRKPTFVTKKIVESVIAIKNGKKDKLEIGNLSAKVDWGFAPDYVNAIIKIIKNEIADDYIVATGELHTVRDFVEIAFQSVDLNWKEYVVEIGGIIKKNKKTYCGDPNKIKRVLNWSPSVTFKGMINMLVKEQERYDK